MNKKEKLLKEIERLKTEKDDLKEEIKRKYDILSKRYEELSKITFKEHNQRKVLKDVLKEFEFMIKVLNMDIYPKKSICNHFGVYARCGKWAISISDNGLDKKFMKVVFEIKEWVGNREIGASKKIFSELKNIFDKKYKVIDFWGGEEGSKSITLVINHKMPPKFLYSLKAYRDKKDVFTGVTNNFGRKFKKQLIKLKTKNEDKNE